jgi:hypothetical protein
MLIKSHTPMEKATHLQFINVEMLSIFRNLANYYKY